MYHYSNAELTDMHFCYGMARGNALEAKRLYELRYPNRHIPNDKTFTAIHQRLRETGTFAIRSVDRGRRRNARLVDVEENILDLVHNDPTISTRQISQEMNISQSSTWRALHEQLLHPYHVQKVQALCVADYIPRTQFCTWYLEQCTTPDFAASILFTDEATFSRNTVINFHNMHQWAEENPHAISESRFQQQFSLNVWVGIIGDHLLGPFFLPHRLTGDEYLNFLQNELPPLLEEIPLNLRARMWFMHDGAPPHFSMAVREHLNQTYPNRWIGRGGPTSWPARSPDLNPIDFAIWGYLKSIVYATPVLDVESLRQRIINGCNIIKNSAGMMANIRRSSRRRAEECIAAGGSHFEQFL